MKLFALENEPIIADVPDDPNAFVEVETTIGQIEHLAEEVIQDHLNVEAALESIDTLCDLSGVVQGAIDDKVGLDQYSAEAVRVTLESIQIRLGMPAKKLAMEGFANPDTRLTMTEAALESNILDSISRIWTGIANHLTRIWNNISDFFHSYVSVYKKYLKMLDELEIKLEGKSKGTMKKSEFNDSTIARQLTYDGTTANAESASKLMDNTNKLSTKAFTVVEKTIDLTSKVLKELTAEKYNFEPIFKELMKFEEELLKSLPQTNEGHSVFDKTRKFGPTIGYNFMDVGNVTIVIDGSAYEFDMVNIERGKSIVSMVSAIQPSEIAMMIKETKTFAKTSLSIMSKDVAVFKVMAKLYEILPQITRTIQSMMKKDPQNKQYVRLINRFITSIIQLTHEIYFEIPYYSFRGLRAMTRYIEMSINNIKTSETA